MMQTKGRITGVLICVMFFLPQIVSGSGPNHRFEVLISQGEIDLKAGRLEAALDSFLSAEKIDSSNEKIQHKLGGLYLLKGDYPPSVRHFRNALKLNAKRPQTFIGLGLVYLHLSQYGLASAALEEARALSPSRKEDIERLIKWIDQRNSLNDNAPVSWARQ